MTTYPNPGASGPSPNAGDTADAYDVIIVRRTPGLDPQHLLSGAEPVRTLRRSVPSWSAVACAQGFNQEEEAHPLGLWAVIRKSNPERPEA